MQDTLIHLSRFANNYINVRGRMNVKTFNWILFFVFLPLLVLQIIAVQKFFGSVGNIATGNILTGLTDIKNILIGLPETQQTWVHKWLLPALPYLLYYALLPAVIMRLRDIGWPTYWAAVLATGTTLGLLNTTDIMPISALYRLPLSCIEITLITFLTFKRSHRKNSTQKNRP